MPNKFGKVLVVDDEAVNRDIFHHLLHETVEEIASAADAKTALEILETFPADLALLDVMMPGMNGYDLCTEIKSRFPHMKIAFVSARNSRDDVHLGFSYGADEYIGKPFDLDDFVARVKALLQRDKPPALAAITPKERTGKILVVDDDPGFLDMMEEALNRSVCQVVKAPGSESALEWLERFDADVALIDVRMPGMNGLELCQRVKRQYPKIKIGLVTALSSESDRRKGIEAGADVYIVKPFQLDDLIARVSGLLTAG